MKTALIAVLMIVTWLALGNKIGTSMDEHSYRALNQQRPVSQLRSLDGFVILAVCQRYPTSEVDALSYPYAAEFLRTHPGYSFLIPDGKDEELSRILASKRCYAGFTAERLPDGSQRISLLNEDGIALFCYTATASTVTPTSFCRAVSKGRGMYYAWGAMAALPLTAVLWLAIWGGATLLRRTVTRQS